MTDSTDLIFENYSSFLEEHDNIGTASGGLQMLTSDGAFISYINSITEGLSEETKEGIVRVAKRERELLLEESFTGNLAPSATIIGYAVSYFPILADIYSDPVISQIATIYPVNKSIVSIPKITVDSSVLNSDGTTSNFTIPREFYQVRGKGETISLLPNISNDLFALSTGGLVNASNSKINQRFLIFNNLVVTDDGGTTSAGGVTNVATIVRPDARGQIRHEIVFQDFNGENVTASIIGSVNWDRGTVQYSVNYTNSTLPSVGTIYTTTRLDATVVFSAKTSDVGRVKVKLAVSGWDVHIDVRDDFEIELEAETIQDYRDIYNIDLIRSLSLAIKQQVLLNKDFDLAFYLQAFEPEYARFGSAATVDLNAFRTSGSDFTPANVMDVFKGVIPAITSVNRNIRRNFRADPQYLVAGLKMASLLESIQEYAVNMSTSYTGEAGYSGKGQIIDFKKQMVLACPAIPDDKIYIVYKAPTDDLSRSVIVDLIYQPLYIMDEVTNSQHRTFVRSRSAIEFVNLEAIGVVTVTNFADLIP